MTVESSASAVCDTSGVRISSDSERVLYLNKWVRDYVDKRSVTDGMLVLVAEVNVSEFDVIALTINASCSSERAGRESETFDTIRFEEL